jgi:sterol desaturase/sphingolipid hydroxylase (fatty acid hydroxylase superfamily)
MGKNFVSNKDETVRMFKSDFFEALSKVHFTVPLYIYLPVVFYFLYRSIFLYKFSFITILVLVLFGMGVWTITEYTLHRFIFHYEAKSKFGERIHFIFHGVHHDYPNDSKRLVMPPSVSIPLAVLFYFIFNSILGNSLVAPFFVGFILGYLFYDLTHYAVHHYNMHNKFWLAIKNHHMKHHYMNSEKGYGVSSPVWDEVLGTNFSEIKKK